MQLVCLASCLIICSCLILGPGIQGTITHRRVAVAYQVVFESGIGQFREFEPPRVHTRIYSYTFVWILSCGQIDLRKARERELATLDEKSTSSGIAEPYARLQLKARNAENRHVYGVRKYPRAGFYRLVRSNPRLRKQKCLFHPQVRRILSYLPVFTREYLYHCNG